LSLVEETGPKAQQQEIQIKHVTARDYRDMIFLSSMINPNLLFIGSGLRFLWLANRFFFCIHAKATSRNMM
jgi:hypothetical protein